MFNQAAFRVVLKPEGMSSGAQTTYTNTNKRTYASFMCTLSSRLPFIPFPIVSVAVSITVFASFDRCLNLFRSITKH